MWEFAAEYGLFLAKAVTIVAAILVVLTGIVAAGGRMRRDEDGHIEVRKLNERYRSMREALREASLEPAMLKRERRQERKEEKRRRKQQAKATGPVEQGEGGESTAARRVFVVNFNGDLRAQGVDALRQEISAVLSYAEPADSVLVRVESAGGLVHAYGLAASQLARVRDAGIPLVVSVDKVAASGGYLMACVADRILAAPFAMVGSIGVVAQLPNFHRLLRRHDIDYELLTAGQYKRTLTLFGQNSETGRRKFMQELEDTHALFKAFVARYRSQLDVEKVATGEVWFGTRAIEMGLVDELGTGDDFLLRAAQQSEVLEVRYVIRKPLAEKFGLAVESVIERGTRKALDQLAESPGEQLR